MKYFREMQVNQPLLADNYKPTAIRLEKLFDFYKKTARAKGYNVSDDAIRSAVKQTWEGAELEKGFIRAGKIAPGTVKLKNVPEFILDSFKSELVRDKSFIKRADTNLAEVTGVAKSIIQKTLGKSKSPINTLVEGVTNLSAQVHSGEAFDQMMKRSNELKVAYDKWLHGFKQIDPITKKDVPLFLQKQEKNLQHLFYLIIQDRLLNI